MHEASGALQHQAERGQPIPSRALQEKGRSLRRRRRSTVRVRSVRGGVWVRGDSVSIVPAPDSPLSRGSGFPRSAQQTNAPQPFFPSLRSDVINYHQNARDSERECVSLLASVCACERERKNERGSRKERDHCLRWNKEISTEPL